MIKNQEAEADPGGSARPLTIACAYEYISAKEKAAALLLMRDVSILSVIYLVL